MESSLKKARQLAEQKFYGQEKKTRQLTVALAARACELEKGRRPENAADLTPEYLKAVPKDPASGKNLVLPP